MIRQSTAVWSLCLTLLVGAAAWGAPIPARPAPITAITVTEDSGDRPGFSGGAGESWTLRPNGVVSHSVSLSTGEQMNGGEPENKVSGAFNKKDFARLASYLESSHVFKLKVAEHNDNPWEDNGVIISVVRGGKTRSIRIPDSTPSRSAAAVSRATVALVRTITAKTDWKNPAGYSVNTGLGYQFIPGAEGDIAQFKTPVFLVRNAAGKEVGTLKEGAYGGGRLALPPGDYRLVRPEPGASGDASHPGVRAYAWRAPAAVEVKAGHYTIVQIHLQKMPAAP